MKCSIVALFIQPVSLQQAIDTVGFTSIALFSDVCLEFALEILVIFIAS